MAHKIVEVEFVLPYLIADDALYRYPIHKYITYNNKYNKWQASQDAEEMEYNERHKSSTTTR